MDDPTGGAGESGSPIERSPQADPRSPNSPNRGQVPNGEPQRSFDWKFWLGLGATFFVGGLVGMVTSWQSYLTGIFGLTTAVGAWILLAALADWKWALPEPGEKTAPFVRSALPYALIALLLYTGGFVVLRDRAQARNDQRLIALGQFIGNGESIYDALADSRVTDKEIVDAENRNVKWFATADPWVRANLGVADEVCFSDTSGVAQRYWPADGKHDPKLLAMRNNVLTRLDAQLANLKRIYVGSGCT